MTRPRGRRYRLATVVWLLITIGFVVASTAAPAATRPVTDMERRSNVIPTPPHVVLTASNLVGGPDRLVLVTESPRRAPNRGAWFEVREFDRARRQWRRRPDAPGLPAAVRGALVTASLRCGPEEDGNARCDVVASVLLDGESRWRSHKVSGHREWVHETGGAVLVGATDTHAVFWASRAGSMWLSLSARGVVRLPLPPSSAASVSTTCVAGSHVTDLEMVGVGSADPTPGVARVARLDLNDREPRWSRERIIAGPAGPTSLTRFDCFDRGLAVLDPPRVEEWTGRRWRTAIPAGTPPDARTTLPYPTGRDLFVVAPSGPQPFAPTMVRWWHRGRWNAVPTLARSDLLRVDHAPIVPFGRRFVGMLQTVEGPQLQVLQPQPLSG